MSFNSTEFVFFFLAVFFGYWALARTLSLRFAFLLAASCVFYMSWNAKFVLLLVASTLLDFYCGRAIHLSATAGRRRLFLACSLTGNLGLLGFFKYCNFFAENVAAALARLGFERAAEFVPWHIVLPAGISFYTFQTLSYTLDVYRGKLAPTDSLLKFALFVTFFPQLVAGPIVRAADFLPQLEEPARFSDEGAQRGVFLILRGLAKKVLLADTIGHELVDPVYADPGAHGALGVALGTWAALFQFYLDFSAYSDIAIGAARCLGFRLPVNFDRPFLAQSISEFWRRWHISLSSWFRDYAFVAFGGRGASLAAYFRNILATMLLVGLWHGAGWNYVLWGAMHGVFTFLGVALGRRRTDAEIEARPAWEKLARRAWVFNVVALSMLFFRNGTLLEGNRGVAGSLDMLGVLASFAPGTAAHSSVGLAALAIAAAIHWTPRGWLARAEDAWVRAPAVAQAFALVAATGALAALSYAKAPFIYFQF
jgi:D-alanyl-lipoteichoic acid acyltransferase DltB (MBOAT superfamily)